MSISTTTAIRASRATKLTPTSLFSIRCVNGRRKTFREKRVSASRPPSRAGIGSELTIAKVREIRAITISTTWKPWPAPSLRTKKMPIGPVTESLARWVSPEKSESRAWPKPWRVTLAYWPVSTRPVSGADQVFLWRMKSEVETPRRPSSLASASASVLRFGRESLRPAVADDFQLDRPAGQECRQIVQAVGVLDGVPPAALKVGQGKQLVAQLQAGRLGRRVRFDVGNERPLIDQVGVAGQGELLLGEVRLGRQQLGNADQGQKGEKQEGDQKIDDHPGGDNLGLDPEAPAAVGTGAAGRVVLALEADEAADRQQVEAVVAAEDAPAELAADQLRREAEAEFLDLDAVALGGQEMAVLVEDDQQGEKAPAQEGGAGSQP